MITKDDVMLTEALAVAGTVALTENWKDKLDKLNKAVADAPAVTTAAAPAAAAAAAPAAAKKGFDVMGALRTYGQVKPIVDKEAGELGANVAKGAISQALKSKGDLAAAGTDIAKSASKGATQSAIDTAFGNRGKLTGMAHSTGSASVHGALSALSKPKNLGKLALGGAAVAGGAALANRAANIGRNRGNNKQR